MRKNTFLMPEGFYVSASKINLFNQCEKCFYLKYVLWVPAPYDDDTPYNYGKAVHNTVDAISQWQWYDASIEDFNTDDDYKTYMLHKDMIEREFAGIEWLPWNFFVPEIEFVSKIDWVPVYWFFDWLMFDNQYQKELEIRKFIPRAVEMQENWKWLLWYWFDSNWEKKVITSEIWKFWESKILKLVEMKTQANKWSYNSIKTNYQFMLYWMVKEKFFWDILFQLVNFYRKPMPWIQKERIVIDENQEKILTDKIKEIERKCKDNSFKNESTCWHFSPYKEICQNFTI